MRMSTTTSSPINHVTSPEDVAGALLALSLALCADRRALANAYRELHDVAALRHGILASRCARIGTHPGRGCGRSRRKYGPSPTRTRLRDMYSDLAALAWGRYSALMHQD